ncbi:MAG: quinolinate synthase NadA [Bacteroidota bacterium]|jgi:quinolinate synthase|nr:quinolinate synthase NadA [Bacteroidota bacterium]
MSVLPIATSGASRTGLDQVTLLREVLRLKKELNAVILAHYYQDAVIQDLADIRGDSFELSRRARETDADVIVFAGVHFMAETAKILNPEKTVLLPDMNAGCSLAESAPAHLFRRFRAQHPDHLAVTYINCTAEVKALSDVICTSSSAERILERIPEEIPVLFSPDKNLGRYVRARTGRRMLLWQGVCTVHEQFSARRIADLKAQWPDAEVIAHPECEGTVLELADFIGSTSALLARVQSSDARRFIVATEAGILHQMQRAAPDKEYMPAPPDNQCACNVCDYMKVNTLEKLYLCMRDRTPEIVVPEEVRQRALPPIERMLALAQADDHEAERILATIRLPWSEA